MVEELFRVYIDIPDGIDMNCKMFERGFLDATEGSMDTYTQDAGPAHSYRFMTATFGSFYQASECDRKLCLLISKLEGKRPC